LKSILTAKDAKRLSKMIKQEAKTEALAVKGAIKELEALQKVQKDAAAVSVGFASMYVLHPVEEFLHVCLFLNDLQAELKAQQKAAQAARFEHKARMK
jgi:hypothetical protein